MLHWHPGDLIGNINTSGQDRKGGFFSQLSMAKLLSPLTTPASFQRCWVPALIRTSLALVLRKSQKSLWEGKQCPG